MMGNLISTISKTILRDNFWLILSYFAPLVLKYAQIF